MTRPLRILLGLASWLATVAITLVGLAALTFFIGRILPIDPVLSIVGEKASPEVYNRVYLELGLDKPVWVQFWDYISKLLHGDFGISFATNRPVLTDLLNFFPATLELSTIGLLIGVVLGVPMGVASAYWHEKWPDHVLRVVGLVGYSVPIFWLGLVGLFVFYYLLGWVSGPGQLDVFYVGVVHRVTGSVLIDSALQGEWEIFANAVSHMTLPALLLGYYSLAYISRMTRSVMLDQLSREYVLTARLKGASELRAVVGHALRNAAIPLVTVIALSYGGLLEGSVLIETIFSWPGIGNYIYSSLFAADMNAVLGGTLLVGVVFVILNMLSDVLYRALDPRSREFAK
ncbi:MAG: Binding-protein-dependent transport system inner rane component [Devosia sp.]|uniref:ABC transporter permease n=1 Tax=Devosia sp. TaxID=1871048 RepID=UPI00261B3245|nr:ABC transporter permease [Devosia sp.]MDB5542108.1 Binding-protein-dependent transport system inner rane component [Devosia sp.]